MNTANNTLHNDAENRVRERTYKTLRELQHANHSSADHS